MHSESILNLSVAKTQTQVKLPAEIKVDNIHNLKQNKYSKLLHGNYENS